MISIWQLCLLIFPLTLIIGQRVTIQTQHGCFSATSMFVFSFTIGVVFFTVLIILSDTVSHHYVCHAISIYSQLLIPTIAWDNVSLVHWIIIHAFIFAFNGIYLNFKRPNLILPALPLFPFQFVLVLSNSLRLMKSSRLYRIKKGHAIFPIRILAVLSFNAIARRFLFFDIFTWLTNFSELFIREK